MSINVFEVDQVLEQLALNGATRFNAYYVSHLSKQEDVDEVNDYLMMKAKFGVLIVRVETICPNSHVDQQFDGPLPNYEIECRFCEEMYTPDPLNTNVVFYFTTTFAESVKKKQALIKVAI
ncbi:hypothetical protein [Paenibacillus aquistagni]|uniref:Uncharacterized protein n=1 Tax=Paenibacillus aquistagni TaxID=1852522 RepID=A0A1X7LRL8_9BACL|nr:hypothetical protein [Paenibacillus aquistagni]SMG56465.1 hypothetical protein SAMN06295960_4135 [Paenibacillus aquistagni]